MIYSYPAIFLHEDDGGFSVILPDFEGGTTCGNNFNDAMGMAIDLLAGLLCDLRDDNKDFPQPSKINEINVDAILNPLSIEFDSNNDFTSYVSVDYENYEKEVFNVLVKKTLQIPKRIDKKARNNKINFSKFLTNALIVYFKENNL